MHEYAGDAKHADWRVIDARATSYPMYKSVIEVKIAASEVRG